MGKARITYEVIAGVLSVCMLGGATAMCVPDTQTKIADYTAENLSPKYAQIAELTQEQQEKLKNLEIEIDENGKVIINLQADLDKANSDIEKITDDLDVANGKIKDKDDQITTLKSDKAELEKQVAALENNTGVSCLGSYYSLGYSCTVPEEKLNSWFYSELLKDDAISFLTYSDLYFSNTVILETTFDDYTFSNQFYIDLGSIAWYNIQVSLDGVSKTRDDIIKYCDETTSDVIGFEVYLSVDESSVVSTKINFKTTRLLTGVYYAADGTFVDFDNLANSTNSNFVNWSYICLQNYKTEGYCFWFYIDEHTWTDEQELVTLGDDYFICDGVQFTKTAPTPTAET